jgi:hypothetical protein
MNKQPKQLEFIFVHPCETVYDEVVFGYDVQVSYLFRIYEGEHKVQAKYRKSRELIGVKGYGLMINRSLVFEGEYALPAQVIQRLKIQGYKVTKSHDVGTIAVLQKDLGYMNPRSGPISDMIWKRLNPPGHMANWERALERIRSIHATWGDTVVDVNGKLVYEDDMKTVKRDPFAREGRNALRNRIAMRRMQNIANSVSRAIDPNNNDKGVGL